MYSGIYLQSSPQLRCPTKEWTSPVYTCHSLLGKGPAADVGVAPQGQVPIAV